MKTIITILVAAFAIAGLGVGDALAIKTVSPRQMEAEYRQLQIQHTFNNDQIEAFEIALANPNAKYAAALRVKLAALHQKQVILEGRMRNIEDILKRRVNTSVIAPNLTNGTLDQAKLVASKMQLGLRWTFKEVSSPSGHNKVLSQSVQSGATVSIGAMINVVVGFRPKAKTPPKAPEPKKTVWVMMKGYPKANPGKKPLKTITGRPNTPQWCWGERTVRLNTKQAIIRTRDGGYKTVGSDWEFHVGFQGKIPTTLSKGDTFTIKLVGKAGGQKMTNYIGKSFGVRMSGLDCRVHEGGKNFIFVGRSASTGKLYTNASKTLTFTVQNDSRRPRLHFNLGNWGTVASYEWEKAGS